MNWDAPRVELAVLGQVGTHPGVPSINMLAPAILFEDSPMGRSPRFDGVCLSLREIRFRCHLTEASSQCTHRTSTRDRGILACTVSERVGHDTQREPDTLRHAVDDSNETG